MYQNNVTVDVSDERTFDGVNELGFGSLVLASRFRNKNKQNIIEYGHRVGPYIVIFNDGKKLYCVKGSSSKNVDNLNVTEKFHISKNYYGLTKDTIFDLRYLEVIYYRDVLAIKDKLNFSNRKRIQKNLMILKNNGRYSDKDFINYSLNYEVGDIIKRNNDLYLIISVENNKYSLVPIVETFEDLDKFIMVDKTKYFIDFDKIIDIEDYIPGDIIASSTRKQLLYTSSYFKEYLGSKNKIEKANIGSLLSFNNCFYYIYGENSDKWLVFQVSDKEYVNSVPIIIDGKVFYTNFSNNREVLKNTAFHINYLSATETERKQISLQKKDYKRTKKNASKNKNVIDSRFKVGDIVKTRTMSEDYYIVIKILRDGVYCVRYDDIKNDIYKPEFFNISFLIKKGTIPKECYNVVNNEIVFNEKVKKLVFRD